MNDAVKIARYMIKEHEGKRLMPYSCSEGKMTIGYGRNLTDVGISESEAETLFENDLDRAYGIASQYVYFDELDPARQAALMDMAFQLGVAGLAGFKKMHRALAEGNFELAAAEALDSLWANQTPSRAEKIAGILRGD